MRYKSISLLRVIATLMVVIVHFGQSLPLPDYVHKAVRFGQHGVTLFFILSGYLIAASLSKNVSLAVYYKKRIHRIVPIYYVVVVINMIVYCLLNYETLDLEIVNWLRYFTFTHCIFPTSDYFIWNNCAALWTMSAFAVFYLIAPLLHKVMNNSSYRLPTLVVIGGG